MAKDIQNENFLHFYQLFCIILEHKTHQGKGETDISKKKRAESVFRPPKDACLDISDADNDPMLCFFAYFSYDAGRLSKLTDKLLRI